MSKITKVNGDYRLQVQTGGNIILDTGNVHGGTTGNIIIYGNLDIKGITTAIETTNVDVGLNILTLNYGDLGSGSGISLVNNQQAGIAFNRGTNNGTSGGTPLPTAELLYDDSVSHYDSVTSADKVGTFSLQTSDGYLSGLRVRTLSVKENDTNDLIFDTRNTAVRLRIEGTSATPYYQRIANTDTHVIPNLEYLRKYIASDYTGAYPFTQGQAIVSTIQYPNTASLSAANTSIQAGSTNVSFYVAQVLKATVDSTGLNVGTLNLATNTITNNTGNLTLSSTNEIELNTTLTLDNKASAPTYSSTKTKIYSSATTGPAKTGLYFTNSSNQTPDELISRNRAVLLSILL
jgi:hypothetical protein